MRTKRAPRWVVPALLSMLTVAAVAGARPGRFHHGPEGAGRWMEARDERTIELLELSEEQAVRWRALRDEHLAAQRARLETVRELHDRARDMVETESPDAEAIGRTMIAAHREMEAARAAREELRGSLAALLTPDQLERFEALRAAREDLGHGHRGGPFGHLGRE